MIDMERFAKVVNDKKSLTTLIKCSFLDDSQGSEYVSVNRQNMQPITLCLKP